MLVFLWSIWSRGGLGVSARRSVGLADERHATFEPVEYSNGRAPEAALEAMAATNLVIFGAKMARGVARNAAASSKSLSK